MIALLVTAYVPSEPARCMSVTAETVRVCRLSEVGSPAWWAIGPDADRVTSWGQFVSGDEAPRRSARAYPRLVYGRGGFWHGTGILHDVCAVDLGARIRPASTPMPLSNYALNGASGWTPRHLRVPARQPCVTSAHAVPNPSSVPVATACRARQPRRGAPTNPGPTGSSVVRP